MTPLELDSEINQVWQNGTCFRLELVLNSTEILQFRAVFSVKFCRLSEAIMQFSFYNKVLYCLNCHLNRSKVLPFFLILRLLSIFKERVNTLQLSMNVILSHYSIIRFKKTRKHSAKEKWKFSWRICGHLLSKYNILHIRVRSICSNNSDLCTNSTLLPVAMLFFKILFFSIKTLNLKSEACSLTYSPVYEVYLLSFDS